jgi:hypothetical protein
MQMLLAQRGAVAAIWPTGIPTWIKVTYTLMASVIVAVYYIEYGPKNYLWFSDLALIATVPALWLESQLLTSAIAVGVLLPELAWNLDFFGRLLAGKRLLGLSDYMFDRSLPRYLRALSLFHVVLPPLLLGMLAQLGYDPAGAVVQTLVAWIVLPLTYAVTDPQKNINWVFGWRGRTEGKRPSPIYLVIWMLAFPVCIYLPTHFLLDGLFDS